MFTFKVPWKFNFWTFRKTKMPNCIILLLVPTLLQTAKETLPVPVIYVFKQGGLYLIL